MESYLSLVAITKKRAVSAPPTTSYEINPVKRDTILNTVLCNIKVSKIKLSNHRKLTIFALLPASGDVESNPGPVTDPCMLHHASESVCPCGYCQLAVGWTPAVTCDQCEVWYHKSCLGMTPQSCARLNSTVSWYCPKCESTNVSTTFLHEWLHLPLRLPKPQCPRSHPKGTIFEQ